MSFLIINYQQVFMHLYIYDFIIITFQLGFAYSLYNIYLIKNTFTGMVLCINCYVNAYYSTNEYYFNLFYITQIYDNKD